jgi:protein O-GlcNAcase/histone acetyltransferase
MRGYIEGYYGRILSWQDRHRIIDQLATLGMSSYLYAPKEDVSHRLRWRTAWDAEWCAAFADFCAYAATCNIQVLAGIAPGIDFDFHNEINEFKILVKKSNQLVDAGADGIVLMFDDIEPEPETFAGLGRSEAQCHGEIAVRLASEISVPLSLVPRIYADEISGEISGGLTREAAGHYQELAAALPDDMAVFHCGAHIVAGDAPLDAGNSAVTAAGFGRLVLWDNLYCNDYCPRRLFVGPYQRNAGNADNADNAELMLNGTGMVESDLLLLSVMQAGDDDHRWQAALRAHGVPDAFFAVAAWFDAPVISGTIPKILPGPDAEQMAAIEHLLWRWKTPLAREWYPFLFGLKHDALIQSGEMPAERVAKTQLAPLYQHLDQDRDQHLDQNLDQDREGR